MAKIRRFVRKRNKYNEQFDRGYMYYSLQCSGGNTVDKIKEVLSQINKDFPNTTDEQIAIKTFIEGRIVLFFYTFEIPIELKIYEFNY